MASDIIERFRRMPTALKVPVLGNVLLLIPNFLWAISQMGAKIDPGLATLLGATFGLGIVGWQTNRGFRNLIRSQANQAELDRTARLHTLELERTKRHDQQGHDKQLLMSGIRAEMASLYDTAGKTAKSCHQFALIYKGMHECGASSSIRELVIPGFKAPFYKENIGKLGILGVSLAADVIKVFTAARDDQKVVWETPAPNSVVSVAYATAAVLAYTFQSDLYQAAMRIRSVEEGTTDPGTLSDTAAARHADLPKVEDMIPKKMF